MYWEKNYIRFKNKDIHIHVITAEAVKEERLKGTLVKQK